MPEKKTTKKSKTAIAKKETKVVAKTMWNKEQMLLITRTVAKGASMDELSLFMYTANKLKLDPLAKQVYCVFRGSGNKRAMTIQVGIDGLRAVAERTKQYAGMEDCIFDEGITHEKGEPQNPSKAKITVYRITNGMKVGFSATARWKEHKPSPPNDFMWKKMPYGQLEKCAEAKALRKAFPQDLSGLYIEEEMGRAGDVIDTTAEEPKTATTTKKAPKTTQTTKQPKKEEEGVIDGEIVDKEYEVCKGCDIKISISDAELSKKLSSDGKEYCSECLKSNRK